MSCNPYAAQMDVSILTAEPIELVRMLYRTALGAVSAARAHLAAGEIKERSQAINRAVGILHELAVSLKPEVEPMLARTLAELYDYMQRRLVEANCGQSDAPLEEVMGLLETMTDAWCEAEPNGGREAERVLVET